MNKAFFINGGAGRVLCSMPALERHKENGNDDFIIVSESWSELYLNNKNLRDHVYPLGHKDLFEEKLKDKKIISPEPYRVNQYFNQKCNLIQAFDIEINELDEVPETGKINLDLNKEDQITGHNLILEVKETLKKDKVVIFQPFGQSAKAEGNFIYDSTGRSFEVSNIIEIIKELNKDFCVILMSEIEIPGWTSLGVAKPTGIGLNGWAGVINAADYFLGCDSVGQHLAHAVGKPATVVIGSTFPENISYPESKDFTIIDNGKDKRRYSPIRMTIDLNADRNNEDLMVVDKDTVKKIVKSIKDKVGSNSKNFGLKAFSPKKSDRPMAISASTNVTPPVKKFGEPFTVPKSKKKKKPIDEILEIEAKKS
tara:strand:- start:1992 stop:3095 length:1104 start_codon:yes stop_codon:yes gene_type:complete